MRLLASLLPNWNNVSDSEGGAKLHSHWFSSAGDGTTVDEAFTLPEL